LKKIYHNIKISHRVDPIKETKHFGFLIKNQKEVRARTKSWMLAKGLVVVKLQHCILKLQKTKKDQAWGVCVWGGGGGGGLG
jgi:hypothetical protein